MEKISLRTANLFFLCFVLAYIGLSMLAGILLSGLNLPYWSLFVVSDAVLLFPVLVFLGICKVNPLKMECVRFTRISNIVLSVIYAYALLPLMLFLNMLTMTFTENAVNDMLAGISGYSLGFQLLLMAVMPAIVEEFVFRGVLREPYRKRNILGAALISGLYFGIIHMNFNQFAYAFAMGIAFALLVEASGSILCSVAAHFAINANSVLLTFLSARAEGLEAYVEQAETTGEMMPGIGLPPMVYVFVLSLVVGGAAIAIVVLRSIARRSGRLAHMEEIFQDGFRPKNADTEKFVDIYFLGAVAIGFGFMIMNL